MLEKAYVNDGQAFSAQSHWSYSDPSSSVFYVGANANTNANQNDFIAYCFAPVAGYSAFGSYTGNGSTDGPFIHTVQGGMASYEENRWRFRIIGS